MLDTVVLHIWLDVIGDRFQATWLERNSNANTCKLKYKVLDSVWRIFDVTVRHCWTVYGVYVCVIWSRVSTYVAVGCGFIQCLE
jgi:hypothetical protein